MASDDDRLVIPTPEGQLTVSLQVMQHVGGAYTLVNLVIDDDTTGDTERGFGCTARATFSIDQVEELSELRDFLNQILKRGQKT